MVGSGPSDGFGGYRARLVETLRQKGVRDLAVLHAVAQVPRHHFVPPSVRHNAYEDSALPIGSGQTISQPFIQAKYLETVGLTGKERVLEIGTGSGYQTALISLLAETVFTIERVRVLSESARKVLESAGFRNIQYIVGDGTLGWRPGGPYDAILVSAASPEIPQPLVDQLAPGGRMVVPVGDRDVQTLVVVRRGPGGIETSTIGDARFVPLIGQHGWR
ncbi:MAG TPA: protein-L-isoaspartate(D-aspartate) O-methyltransferase [Gemmatimonadales bacterium]|nr:protein-L-isoaspartate(D-aspartate) O-methyltransferase [Gemmatimonadales bacterium]